MEGVKAPERALEGRLWRVGGDRNDEIRWCVCMEGGEVGDGEGGALCLGVIEKEGER